MEPLFIVSGRTDEKIAQIAARQRGYVARRQLLSAGVSSAAIDRLLGRGLVPAHPGVYRVGHGGPAEWGAETAALLATRKDAALGHLSAGGLWELTPRRATDSRPIDIVVKGARGRGVDGVTCHRSRCLQTGDVVCRQSLPVTSPARTLLDLATILNERQLELAYDRAIVAGIVTREVVAGLLSRTTGHPGRGRLRALIEAETTTTVTRSEAEERMLALLRAAHLPMPAINSRLLGYELDFLWREQRLVVEVDGFRFHSSRRAFEHDRRKDAELAAAGIMTLRITWRQLEREPYAVVALIAQALARADAISP